MTTIVARRTKNGAEFAYDSQTTWGGSRHISPSKVFINGPVTFGVAGSVRVSDLLEHGLDVPEFIPDRDGGNIHRWIIRELMPAIDSVLTTHSAQEVLNGQSDNESHIILYCHGFLGVMSSNLAIVGAEDEVVGVGSGSKFARGAVLAGAGLKKAVEIASQLDIYTDNNVNYKEVK